MVSSLPGFLAAASRAPNLSREEELQLARQASRGIQSAKDALILAAVKHAVAVAYKLRHYPIDTDDLVSEALSGLAYAVTKFDPDRGTRFITYAAHWMRAHTLQYLIRNWRISGAGHGALRSGVFFKLRKEHTIAMAAIGDEDEVRRELARSHGVTEVEMGDLLSQLSRGDSSLDVEISSDHATTWLDTLVDTSRGPEASAIDDEERARARSLVSMALKSLDAREALIVQSHVMADREERKSLSELGRELGISRERARQLSERAMDKLGRNLGTERPRKRKRTKKEQTTMPTSHRDSTGLTGHQVQLLREACQGRVTCDGRRARAARILLARGLAEGPPVILPDGTPSTKWVEATRKGRSVLRELAGVEES